MNLNQILCSDCKKKIKAMKRSAKCLRKLKTRTGATYQQKQSWKYHIAKGMRACPTAGEARMLEILTVLKDQYRWSLATQKQIGPYIVDFCITNRNVVIEVDGSVHETQKEYDAAREKSIMRDGYKVLHFSNADTLDPKLVERILVDALV